MKAIYDNRLFNVADVAGDLTLEARDGTRLVVDFGDDRLIVDPTDEQVADTSNLAEWYAVDVEDAERLRLMLRGDISLQEWQQWKEHRS